MTQPNATAARTALSDQDEEILACAEESVRRAMPVGPTNVRHLLDLIARLRALSAVPSGSAGEPTPTTHATDAMIRAAVEAGQAYVRRHIDPDAAFADADTDWDYHRTTLTAALRALAGGAPPATQTTDTTDE